MFVGHGLLAFAVVAALAARYRAPERALLAGAVAGAFATVPDVDMLLAVAGAVGAGDPAGATETFWAATDVLHRSVTHSLPIGAVAAVGFGATTTWHTRRRRLALAAALAALGGTVAVVWLAGGAVPTAMLVTFLGAGLAVTAVAVRLGFGARTVLALAAVGLLSHPFGDLLAGGPPALLYPFEWQLLTERLALHPDPTLHLLAAFFVELAVVWLALSVVLRLRGRTVRGQVRPRAALGVGYAVAVLAVPAPTVDVASPFVFSVLAVGVVGVPVPAGGKSETTVASRVPEAVTTALAAVTVAGLAYTGAYLLV